MDCKHEEIPQATPAQIEAVNAEVYELAGKLLDVIELQNAVAALAALCAATYHMAHTLAHAEPLCQHAEADNHDVVASCMLKGTEIAMMLDQTRGTAFANVAQA